jgi:hypothetical protein
MPETYGRAHDGELDIGGSCFGAILVDVLDPFLMIAQVVRGDSDNLDAPFLEFLRKMGNFGKFSGANGCEIARMREQDRLAIATMKVHHQFISGDESTHPRVADPFMEFNWASSSQGLKIGCNASKAEGGHLFTVVVRQEGPEGSALRLI